MPIITSDSTFFFFCDNKEKKLNQIVKGRLRLGGTTRNGIVSNPDEPVKSAAPEGPAVPDRYARAPHLQK